jgi:hypothetical protein
MKITLYKPKKLKFYKDYINLFYLIIKKILPMKAKNLFLIIIKLNL